MNKLLFFTCGFCLIIIFILFLCFVGYHERYLGDYLYPALTLVFSLPVFASYFAIKNWRISGVLICLLYIFMMTITLPIVLGWGSLNVRYKGIPVFFIMMVIFFTLSFITTFLGWLLVVFSRIYGKLVKMKK